MKKPGITGVVVTGISVQLPIQGISTGCSGFQVSPNK